MFEKTVEAALLRGCRVSRKDSEVIGLWLYSESLVGGLQEKSPLMPGEFRGSGSVSLDPKMVSSGVGTAWLRTRMVSLLVLLLCSIRDERSAHEGALICPSGLPPPDDSGVLIRERSNDSRCSSTTVFLAPFLFSVTSSGG